MLPLSWLTKRREISIGFIVSIASFRFTDQRGRSIRHAERIVRDVADRANVAPFEYDLLDFQYISIVNRNILHRNIARFTVDTIYSPDQIVVHINFNAKLNTFFGILSFLGRCCCACFFVRSTKKFQRGGVMMAGLELFISCTFPDGSTTYFQSKLPKKLAANDFEQLVSTVLACPYIPSRVLIPSKEKRMRPCGNAFSESDAGFIACQLNWSHESGHGPRVFALLPIIHGRRWICAIHGRSDGCYAPAYIC